MSDPAIDPLSWVSAERQILANYAATTSQAESDMAGNVADFLKEVSIEQSAEAQFTNDLASLSGMIDPAMIAKTLREITATSASVDAAFTQLNSAILKNNAAAKRVLQQITAVTPNVQKVDQVRSTLSSKLANYKSVIATFRTYNTAATPAPVPEAESSSAQAEPQPEPQPEPEMQ